MKRWLSNCAGLKSTHPCIPNMGKTKTATLMIKVQLIFLYFIAQLLAQKQLYLNWRTFFVTLVHKDICSKLLSQNNCAFILPITTKFNRGLPPCLLSSSALMLIACRVFPEERPGVAAAEISSPFDALDGVSGRLGAASGTGVALVFSGLSPRRAGLATTPFSPELRRKFYVLSV